MTINGGLRKTLATINAETQEYKRARKEAAKQRRLAEKMRKERISLLSYNGYAVRGKIRWERGIRQ